VVSSPAFTRSSWRAALQGSTLHYQYAPPAIYSPNKSPLPRSWHALAGEAHRINGRLADAEARPTFADLEWRGKLLGILPSTSIAFTCCGECTASPRRVQRIVSGKPCTDRGDEEVASAENATTGASPDRSDHLPRCSVDNGPWRTWAMPLGTRLLGHSANGNAPDCRLPTRKREDLKELAIAPDAREPGSGG